MSIRVCCPNGHQLQVKNKYAGKSGLCPKCRARVEVPVVLTTTDILEYIGDWQPPEPIAAADKELNLDSDSDSVLHEPATAVKQESGMSLLGSAIIHHKKACPNCGQRVELQYVSCPRCKQYFED